MKTLNLVPASICVATLILMSFGPSVTTAQHFNSGLGQQTFVDASVEQIEIVVGASKRLKFGYKIPELLVETPEVAKATPVSPTEILISGLKPGLTTITVSDPEKNLQHITIHVTADTRKLEATLNRHFPDSNVKVHALQTGVILRGTVARADQINPIVAIATDYFPTNVINQLQVDSGQMIAIKVKVYEVNRSKLRTAGIDWALFGSDYGVVSSVSNLITTAGLRAGTVASSGAETFSFGVFGNNNDFFKFMEVLETNNLAKLLDQPVLVAQNGRPAEFLSGGEIPIAIASGLGTNSIEFRPFGTKLDMVPLIHGQGELTLEVRAEVSEVDNSLSFGAGVPGFRVRRVNTGVRMKAGHTLALAGDYQESTETEKRGVPFLMDSPLWGPLFRRTTDTTAESELVFLITPRFISEVDPGQVPRLGPGQLTETPSRQELFVHGYLEVPKCNEDCPTSDRFEDPLGAQQYQQSYSQGNQLQQQQAVVDQKNNNGFQQSGFGSQPNAPTGQYPVYQYGQGQGQQTAPVPAQNNSYGAGFGWPQGGNR